MFVSHRSRPLSSLHEISKDWRERRPMDGRSSDCLCREGALGARFGISRFGRWNEFLSRWCWVQIFVCDRSPIIHPRNDSNRAAEWVNRPRCLATIAHDLSR